MSEPGTTAAGDPRPSREVLGLLVRRVLPLLLLLPLTAHLPAVDLGGPLALGAYWLSESGGQRGLPLVALALTGMVVAGAGPRPVPARARHGAGVGLALLLALGGGAVLNEYVTKPTFAVPRPFVLELARQGTLPVTPAEFYARGDKAARSEYLRALLGQTTLAGVPPDPVRSHWIEETGYSFPSGHSFAALLFATFFAGLGLWRRTGALALLPWLLVPWALAVCASRTVLRVHTPVDVTVGGALGFALGALAFLAVAQVARPGESSPARPTAG